MGDDWAADPPEPEGWPLPRRGRPDPIPTDFSDDDMAFVDEDPYIEPVDSESVDSESVDKAEVDDFLNSVPWWVTDGEQIDVTARATRGNEREDFRRRGLSAGYDTFWGHVDDDPVSVLPIVRGAMLTLRWLDVASRSARTPQRLPLLLGAAVATAGAFGIVGGPPAHRLAACATSLVLGVVAALVVSRRVTSYRVAAIGGAALAVACVAVSTVPTIGATRWYPVLMGLAFAGAGLVVAALWPVVRRWRVERDLWTRPELALVAALLEFADCVESDPVTQDRRAAVQALDRAATRFEFAWHRVHRTGVDVTDRQLRGWAGRIRAETRELQRSFAFGDPSKVRLLLSTYLLIQAIVNRLPLDNKEDDWVRHGSWRRPPTSAIARLWARGKQSGRYVRQCLLAAVIASAALLLLAVTVWSAVPTFLGEHISRDLDPALTFDPTMRVFVATISLSLFALAGRAFTHRR
ncbi:hypothetical protein [Micromonospora lupini]|uniref:Uncharacterized protein n=1 Tax=Micromonospora lupini str. Lupac 08 TaxID=1150864 RepID=I0L5Y4_9ACTN|nr:hypothetical protein [Micromonospora lupini]CCH19231.1 Membrane hypothetical protein (probable permease) [Micromonospora lupini str. Lupac 08]